MRRLVTASLAVALLRANMASAACVDQLSTCIEADTFFPHPGPGPFTIVGGTTTTPVGTVGLGWATTYLARPIVLIVPSSDPRGTEVAAVDRLVDPTFLFSYGLHSRIEATLAIPTSFYRSGTGISPLTDQSSSQLRAAAFRDVRFGATFALFPVKGRRDSGHPAPSGAGTASANPQQNGEADHGNASPNPAEPSEESSVGLATRFDMSLPTGDASSFGGDRGAVGMPSIAADLRWNRFSFGTEFGARLRMASDLAGARVGTQLVFALGAGLEVLRNHVLDLLLEGIALPTFAAQHELSPLDANGRRRAADNRAPLLPAEWLFSVRTAAFMEGALSASLGAGGAIPMTNEAAITAPSVRAILMLRYTPRPAR